jgi:hypothetical protein
LYGKTLLGFLHAIPEDEFGCTSNDPIKGYNNLDIMPIVIVKRGTCKFITKTLLAEKLGAKLLIIINDDDKEIDFIAVS